MVINNKIKISSKIKAPIDTYTANTVCATLLMLHGLFKLLTLSIMLTLLYCLHLRGGGQPLHYAARAMGAMTLRQKKEKN